MVGEVEAVTFQNQIYVPLLSEGLLYGKKSRFLYCPLLIYCCKVQHWCVLRFDDTQNH